MFLLGMRSLFSQILTVVGSLLLEDNSSFLLMEDNSSHILGEG